MMEKKSPAAMNFIQEAKPEIVKKISTPTKPARVLNLQKSAFFHVSSVFPKSHL